MAADFGGIPGGCAPLGHTGCGIRRFSVFQLPSSAHFHGRLRKPAGRLCIGRVDSGGPGAAQRSPADRLLLPGADVCLSDFRHGAGFRSDCGSLPAGFALGALTLAGPAPHKGLLLTGFFYPALTFAYPIFDTALVSVLRKLTGRPISLGGRDHSSHRLASLGLDQRQVVWILWLLTAFGASLGIMIHLMPDALFAAGALLLGMLSMLALSLAKLPGYPLPDLMWLRRREFDAEGPGQACS